MILFLFSEIFFFGQISSSLRKILPWANHIVGTAIKYQFDGPVFELSPLKYCENIFFVSSPIWKKKMDSSLALLNFYLIWSLFYFSKYGLKYPYDEFSEIKNSRYNRNEKKSRKGPCQHHPERKCPNRTI